MNGVALAGIRTCLGRLFVLPVSFRSVFDAVQVYMAGLCTVLMLYLVLISLGLASWGKLVEGFDQNDPEHIIRIACEVRMFLAVSVRTFVEVFRGIPASFSHGWLTTSRQNTV